MAQKPRKTQAGRPAEPGSLRSQLERGEARNLKVIVPEGQYKALRVQAALTDMNLSELVSMAIGEWLERHGTQHDT